MVMSEGGQWSYPLKVYEDNATTCYTPDITAPAWVAWNADQFRQSGKYQTYLYVYSKRKQATARWTLMVETRANTAIVAMPFSVQHISLSDHATPAFISKSAAKITAIVTDEVARFHGDTVEDVVQKEKYITLKNILCSNNNPDCDLSDAELKKKYPIYPTSAPQLITGAIPGVNCGIGTNRSCCCAGDAPQPPATMGNAPGAASTAVTKSQNTAPPPIRTDGQIEMDLLHALGADSALKDSSISVATAQGEVTLSGTVPNESCRELAELIAKYVPGVVKVHNNLTVGGARSR
jgi:hypothetical protein